ncbi:MAG: glycosyltransferase [Calothrix sp. SM1_7_51]|nr:glycosyltransferase [Calothrix sp. SM1_7_51]
MAIKVLYFQAHPVCGATESYLSTLAQGLDKKKFQSGIIYPDVADLYKFSKLAGVDCIAVKPEYFAGNVINNAYLIAKQIKKLAPDIIHINDPSPLGVIAASIAGVKKVIITHHTPLLDVKYSWKGNLAKQLAFSLTDYFYFLLHHMTYKQALN